MYSDFIVKIPNASSGITKKTIKGVTYVYYSYDRNYDSTKKYTVPKNTTIGKCLDGEPEVMYPNQNFFRFFPDAEIPEAQEETMRSSCLRIGSFLVLRRIIAGYHLDEIIDRLIEKDGGMFLDLVAYTTIAENNAGQYYPDYAFNHPLFTKAMRVYSDSKISDFINSISRDKSIAFQNEWNEKRNHREKIYISYDSTNKNCQAGELDFVEYCNANDDKGEPELNFYIAYDRNNAVPLFYGEYPGSIVDVSQMQLMLEKANGYGYKHIGFILDRGCFSKENIHFMDKYGYDFVIMMKGMKKFVKELVFEVKGSFEESRAHFIRDCKVSGITLKRRLYPFDDKERYFHIYFNDRRKSAERAAVESKIDRLARFLREHEGTTIELDKKLSKYFDLIYYNQGKPDKKFMFGSERNDVIDEEIKLCGYFVIITSEKMTAEEAIKLYKSRDTSEKLFCGDKSYLGEENFRIRSNESLHAKIFIEFVALIIRNKLYSCLKELMARSGYKQHYMTVPAAIKELEKIEMVRMSDKSYRLDHAVTATQKEILKAFDMTATNVREQSVDISNDLQRYAQQAEK